jgi:beta-mannosidase
LINSVELERSCFVTAELRLKEAKQSQETLISRETILFIPPKYFSFIQPEYNAEISDCSDYFAITIKANTFCRFVRVKIPGEDTVFSDNYFDITSKDGVEIHVTKSELKKDYSVSTLKEALKADRAIFSVGESF